MRTFGEGKNADRNAASLPERAVRQRRSCGNRERLSGACDAENNRPLFEFGMSVGINPLCDRFCAKQREAYAADITYGTNNEYGFDLPARQHGGVQPEERVQRKTALCAGG